MSANTQQRKGSMAKLKALSIELEEKQQEHGYITDKVKGLRDEIKKMHERIEYYEKQSIPQYRNRAEILGNEIGILHTRIAEVTPHAEEEKAHIIRDAKIAELESELRKLRRA